MNKYFPSILLAGIIFNIDSFYDISSRSQIEANLKYTGQNAYFYMAQDVWQDSWQLIIENLSREFDQKIYPQITKIYGSEWRPGIDKDSKITILITPMLEDAGGYFNPLDETNSALSNRREMIYLNSANLENLMISSYLAHEFQHLINDYQKRNLRGVEEELWLNEALSEYAPSAAGLNYSYKGSYLEKRVEHFLKDPSNSLLEWTNSPYDYAVANLFMHYLTDQQGEAEIANILKTSVTGIDAVKNFTNLFTNWAITNYINDCTNDSRFCYKNSDLTFKIKPTANYILFPISSISVGAFTRAWSPHWYKISGISEIGENLKISFDSGNQEYFTVPLIITDKDGRNQIKFLENQALTIPDFGKEINSVTLMPFSEIESNFSFVASLAAVEITEPKEPELLEMIAQLNIRILELRKQILEIKVVQLQETLAQLLNSRYGRIVTGL